MSLLVQCRSGGTGGASSTIPTASYLHSLAVQRNPSFLSPARHSSRSVDQHYAAPDHLGRILGDYNPRNLLCSGMGGFYYFCIGRKRVPEKGEKRHPAFARTRVRTALVRFRRTGFTDAHEVTPGAKAPVFVWLIGTTEVVPYPKLFRRE